MIILNMNCIIAWQPFYLKIDLRVVAELVGHSSVAITADIYAHVLPEQQQEVVDRMGDLFKRS